MIDVSRPTDVLENRDHACSRAWLSDTLFTADRLEYPGAGGSLPPLAEDALVAVGNNCSGLDRNSVCYGFDRVGATFTEEVAEGFFSVPTDRTGLTIVQSIQTASFDPALDQWGIAIMSLQANVPNSLPGQAVVLMLLGEARIENDVAPDNAFVPADPVEAITLTAFTHRFSAGVEISPGRHRHSTTACWPVPAPGRMCSVTKKRPLTSYPSAQAGAVADSAKSRFPGTTPLMARR